MDDEDGDGAVGRYVGGYRTKERAPETAQAPRSHDEIIDSAAPVKVRG